MSYSSRIERLESELSALIIYRREQNTQRIRAHAKGSSSILRFFARNVSKADESISRLHKAIDLIRCSPIVSTLDMHMEVA